MTILITGFENGQLTEEAIQILKSAPRVILHTGRCAAAVRLEEMGIPFETLDNLYDTAQDFDAHLQAALSFLESAGQAVFCVMTEGDEAAKACLQRHPDAVVAGGGIYAPLEMRAKAPCLKLSAQSAVEASLSPRCATLFTEIDSRLLAGELKLRLGEIYGWDAEVFWRFENGRVASVALEDVDRFKSYDHRSACLINPPAVLPCRDMEGLMALAANTTIPDEAPDYEQLGADLAFLAQRMEAARRLGDVQPDELFDLAAERLDSQKLN